MCRLNLYYRFLGLFTYRQRFLFTALFALILATPYQSYITFPVFHLWNRQAAWRVEGDQIQRNLNKMLSAVLLRQELTNNQIIQDANIVIANDQNKEIESLFKALGSSESYGEQKTYLLANGFSEVAAPSLNLIPGKEAWKGIVNKSTSLTPQENYELYQTLVNHILALLKEVEYSYVLGVTTDPLGKSYSRIVLEIIPDMDALINEMMIKSKWIIAYHEDESYLTSQVLGLHEKVKNNLQNFRGVFQSYSEGVKEFDKDSVPSLNRVKKAFEAYFLTVETFLDILANNQFSLLNESTVYENTVKTKEELLSGLYELQHPYFVDAYNHNYQAYYTFIGVYLMLYVMMYFCLKFRLLSSHIEALKKHIQMVSVGKLSYSFTSQLNDEFGLVGRALDKVVDVIRIIISDLVSLSTQIEQITARVAGAVQDQEYALKEQEKIILDGERTADEIADKAQFLSTLLGKISQSSQQTQHAEAADSGLKKMHEHMEALAKSTSQFLINFDKVAQYVQAMRRKVNFMDRLGEQAKTLSLKGKIENATIVSSAGNFDEITNTIERFSGNSEESTSLIKQITKEVSSDVKEVQEEAGKCFSEINAGAEKLTLVSRQLEQIANLAEDQQVKFLKVEEMMKVQAGSSQNMILSIRELLRPSIENAKLVQQLPEIIHSITEQQKKLAQVINQMVDDNEP